jgi:ABC-2 type transport system permease protein
VRKVFNRFFRALIRLSAFLRKEIFEIMRQPRLVFTLVLGPFLILLIFGIGYRVDPPQLRTLFVAHPESTLAQQIEEYAPSLGPQLIYEGVTHDGVAALDLLARGEIDVVALAPDNAYERIRNNEQATFTLYHYEIDPFQVDYINYFGQAYVDEVNRRVLQEVATSGQRDAAIVRQDLQRARSSTAAMRNAIQNEEASAEEQNRLSLTRDVDNVSLAIGATLGLLTGVQQTVGDEAETDADEMLNTLTAIQQDTSDLSEPGTASERIQRVERIDQNLENLETSLAEFQNISPHILVSPFRSETQSIAVVQPTPPDYFAPAVLALLLQHLAVTFAALSIVRERSVGTVELFRVSPLSAGEALWGKYISYLIFGAFIAALLSVLLVFVLNMPMIGYWPYFALVLAGVLFTSLGIGFVISLLSETDSQAVQYSMIVLLASVFFSGFLMELEMLIPSVRVVSWALPTTYGIIMLRDISLRGFPIDPVLIGGLFAIGVVLFIIAWFLLRRLISHSPQ